MKKMHWIKFTTALPVLFVLGCASSIPETESGRDLLSIYELAGTSVDDELPELSRAVTLKDQAIDPRTFSDYTRSVDNEVHNVFSWIPNPTLFLYVPPHTIGVEGFPVLGYTVPFKMYERDHFALPNEVPSQ